MRNFELAHELQEKYHIPIVKNPNYWLVRTESGAYYTDFINNEFVAIGWDYIQLADIAKGSFKKLKEKIKNHEDPKGTKKGSYGSAASKLLRFVTDIKEGDIILIPDICSRRIAIGQTTEDNVYEDKRFKEIHSEDLDQDEICPFVKRRKVKWITQIRKSDIDIYLFKLLNCHHAIYSANEYADYINRSIYPIYISGDKLYATFKAGHINGLSLNEFVDLADFINRLTDGIDKDSIDVKLNIHSPGLIEIAVLITSGGMTIAGIIFALNHLLNGGNTKIDFKAKGGFEFHAQSEGKGLLDKKLAHEKFELDKEMKEQYLRLKESIQLEAPEIHSSDPDEKMNE